MIREYVFYIPSVACTTRKVRISVARNTYLPSEPAHGVWFYIDNLTLSTICKGASGTTTHATTYTLALGTAYRALIEVNSNCTNVNFKLFVDGNDVAVLNNDITTNITTDDAILENISAIASEGASKEIFGLYSIGYGTVNAYNKLG
jgi:hypothetical protein